MTDAGPRGLIPGSTLAPSLRRPVAPSSVASFAPVATASTPETTQLAPEEQAAFEAWLKQNNVHDIDDPRSHYDYRGAFKAGIGREPGAEGHFPDTFKQHGHETFSGESRYSKGPGDGGTWQGDTFIPPKSGMRPSAAAEPLAKGPLGPLPAAPPKVNAPYGMKPGVRHLLPGISPRQAERKTLSVDEDAEFVLPDGSVIPMVSRNPRDEGIVKQLGQSLSMMAATPREQAVARAVEEWGHSVVGQKPIEEIEKRMSDIWDHNVGNVVKRELSRDRVEAAAVNRGNRPGAGPAAADKYDDTVEDKLWSAAEQIVQHESNNNKYSGLSNMENQMELMDAQLKTDSPMAQRMAQLQQLLLVTGKTAVESERSGVTAGAGKWNELYNKFALWSGDERLAAEYLGEFQTYLGIARAEIQRQKDDIAQSAATAMLDRANKYGPEVAQRFAANVYGRISGKWKGGRFAPPKPGETAGTADPSIPRPRPVATPAPKPAQAAPAAPRAAPKAAAPAAPSLGSVLDRLKAKKK